MSLSRGGALPAHLLWQRLSPCRFLEAECLPYSGTDHG